MARIRFWMDVPGQVKRHHASSEWRDITDLSESEVQLWRMQVIAEAGVHNPKQPIPSEHNFEQQAEDFLAENLQRYKRSCRDTFELIVRKHLVPVFGKLAPEEITGSVVNKWLGSVKLLDGGLPSRRTLRHFVATLQVVLGRVFPKKEIRYPADARPKRRINCPTDAQIDQIVGAASGVYRLLFALAASTGMRCGELYGLHIEDIDFERGTIFVRQSLSRGELQSPKTERAVRMISVSPAVIEMIRKFANGRINGILLQTAEGTPLHPSNVLHRQLHPILKGLGLPRFGMHSFRHYSVSYCVRMGMSFDDVRMRHGHGSEEIMRMYLHLAPGHDARILKLVPNVVAEVVPTVVPKLVASRIENRAKLVQGPQLPA